jgi:hypothetical protein
MKKLLIFAALLLSACAAGGGGPASWRGDGKFYVKVQPPKDRKAHYCADASCKVDVTVTVVDGVCTVSADPYALVIGGYGTPVIVWSVTGGDFALNGGIEFEPAGHGVFSLVQGNRRTYTFKDDGTKGIYHYLIQVEAPGGVHCDPLDPTGVNDI